MQDAPRERALPQMLSTPSRRAALRLLTSLGLAGALVQTGTAPGAAKRRGKKKKKGNPCLDQPDNAPCNGGGRCFRHGCVSAPVCLANNVDCQDNDQCCSKACHPAYFHCVESLLGYPCLSDADCNEGTCVGYRCIEII